MLKHLNSRGVSHHFLLPVVAVLLIAGIGGYIMQRSSNAASYCRSRTLSVGSRSECVRDVQYMLGAAPDAIFGPKTRAKVAAFQKANGVKQTGVVNGATWAKLCSQKKGKYRDHACVGRQMSTKSTRYLGYKSCTYRNVSYLTPIPNISCGKQYYNTKTEASKATLLSKRQEVLRKRSANIIANQKTCRTVNHGQWNSSKLVCRVSAQSPSAL